MTTLPSTMANFRQLGEIFWPWENFLKSFFTIGEMFGQDFIYLGRNFLKPSGNTVTREIVLIILTSSASCLPTENTVFFFSSTIFPNSNAATGNL